jgi:5-hydroxyisourate hydrolase
MSGITTHILDTSRGRPAAGVLVVLDHRTLEGYREVGNGVTDGDGRIRGLTPSDKPIDTGVYRLTFHVGAYFHELGVEAFYPEVVVLFHVKDGAQHYHVPLLLNPFGYSTYRGS